ncbi:MAG TPA: pyridoxamine 5'-phosphate oxidase family protein [Cytophagaceae bacterium]|nr:pyridoxamine 5'-phosphate oxidase family protein [Cytophagaceae bacterium]
MKKEEHPEVDRLVELLKEVHTCMLITHERFNGELAGRPMGITKVEPDGTMWFFAKVMSQKVEELEHDEQVSVVIIDEKKNIYLMIHGKGDISYDKEKMKELWNPTMKAWFPEGLDDPDMVLIKIIPTEAKYWESSSSKMVVLFNMVKAAVTGKEYDEGSMGKINL